MPKVRKPKGRVSEALESPAAVGKAVDHFERLPDELVCEILSFLPPRELAQGSVVCQRWNRLSDSHPQWRRWCEPKRWSPNSRYRSYKAVFLSRINSSKFCVECGRKTAAKFPLMDYISLCKECKQTVPKYATSTKGKARTDYLLGDEELDQLKSHKTRPRWAWSKILYLVSDLQEAKLRKWGTEERFRAAKDARDARSKKVVDARKRKLEQARAEQVEGLVHYLLGAGKRVVAWRPACMADYVADRMSWAEVWARTATEAVEAGLVTQERVDELREQEEEKDSDFEEEEDEEEEEQEEEDQEEDE